MLCTRQKKKKKNDRTPMISLKTVLEYMLFHWCRVKKKQLCKPAKTIVLSLLDFSQVSGPCLGRSLSHFESLLFILSENLEKAFRSAKVDQEASFVMAKIMLKSIHLT